MTMDSILASWNDSHLGPAACLPFQGHLLSPSHLQTGAKAPRAAGTTGTHGTDDVLSAFTHLPARVQAGWGSGLVPIQIGLNRTEVRNYIMSSEGQFKASAIWREGAVSERNCEKGDGSAVELRPAQAAGGGAPSCSRWGGQLGHHRRCPLGSWPRWSPISRPDAQLAGGPHRGQHLRPHGAAS